MKASENNNTTIPTIQEIDAIISTVSSSKIDKDLEMKQLEQLSNLRDVVGSVNSMILIVESDLDFELQGELSKESTQKLIDILQTMRKINKL